MEEDGFQIVADDTLYPLIHNRNFDIIKAELFHILQNMINLDNQSMSNQVEAMSSNTAVNNDEEFEMIEDIAVEAAEAMRVIEEKNIMNLKEISLNIDDILCLLDHKPKHVDRIKAEKSFVKNKSQLLKI